MAARPREILTFTGRGTGARRHHRLKAALEPAAIHDDRHVAGQISERRMQSFLLDQQMDGRPTRIGNAR